jgi:flagellar biosynthesis chaperone FliJ
MARTTEQQREYMRRWRRKKRLEEPRNPHLACDRKIVELETIIANQNHEIAVLRARLEDPLDGLFER